MVDSDSEEKIHREKAYMGRTAVRMNTPAPKPFREKVALAASSKKTTRAQEESNSQRASSPGLPNDVTVQPKDLLDDLEEAEDDERFRKFLEAGNTPEKLKAFSEKIKNIHE